MILAAETFVASTPVGYSWQSVAGYNPISGGFNRGYLSADGAYSDTTNQQTLVTKIWPGSPSSSGGIVATPGGAANNYVRLTLQSSASVTVNSIYIGYANTGSTLKAWDFSTSLAPIRLLLGGVGTFTFSGSVVLDPQAFVTPGTVSQPVMIAIDVGASQTVSAWKDGTGSVPSSSWYVTYWSQGLNVKEASSTNKTAGYHTPYADVPLVRDYQVSP